MPVAGQTQVRVPYPAMFITALILYSACEAYALLWGLRVFSWPPPLFGHPIIAVIPTFALGVLIEQLLHPDWAEDSQIAEGTIGRGLLYALAVFLAFPLGIFTRWLAMPSIVPYIAVMFRAIRLALR